MGIDPEGGNISYSVKRSIDTSCQLSWRRKKGGDVEQRTL